MSIDGVVFPKAFRGYDRKAVNEFILKSSRDFTAESDGLKEQIAVLSRTLDEKNSALNEKEIQIEELRSEIDLKNEQAEELKKQIEATKAEYTAKIAQIEQERDKIISDLNSHIQDIEDQLSLVRSERDLMIYEKRRDEEAKISEFEKELIAYREGITGQLRSLTKKCLKEIMSGVGSMQNDLSEISTISENRANKMIDSIETYEEEMKEEIRKVLSEFNKQD